MSIVTKTYWCNSRAHTATIERSSSVIWHGLHSLPYTTKYVCTFFWWFYFVRDNTSLFSFHFLFLRENAKNETNSLNFDLWLVFLSSSTSSSLSFLLMWLPLQFEYVCLALSLSLPMCHSIAMSFEHSMNAIHTISMCNIYVCVSKMWARVCLPCVTENQVALWCQNTFS